MMRQKGQVVERFRRRGVTMADIYGQYAGQFWDNARCAHVPRYIVAVREVERIIGNPASQTIFLGNVVLPYTPLMHYLVARSDAQDLCKRLEIAGIKSKVGFDALEEMNFGEHNQLNLVQRIRKSLYEIFV